MGVLWMTWIRCATDILSAKQKQQISKMILDSLSGVLYVPVIYSTQICTANICIAMKMFTTVPNGSDQLLSHFLWEMLPQKNQDWNVKYVAQRQFILHCVMLPYFRFTPHPQIYQEFVYI